MQSLRPRLDPLWLAHLDQPSVMRANPTPFPPNWASIDLGPARTAEGTYGKFSYDGLPSLPVTELRGDFAWLMACQPWDRLAHMDATRWQQNAEASLRRIADAAKALRLDLPAEFLRFMGDVALQMRIRSCTDCYFSLPARVAPSPMGDDGCLIRFYSDSQGCLHWYLYVTPSGYHAVLLSALFLGGHPAEELDDEGLDQEEFIQEFEEDESEDFLGDGFWFCALSFETFLFRYWLENEIWYALYDGPTPLTPLQQTYIEHYRKA